MSGLEPLSGRHLLPLTRHTRSLALHTYLVSWSGVAGDLTFVRTCAKVAIRESDFHLNNHLVIQSRIRGAKKAIAAR